MDTVIDNFNLSSGIFVFDRRRRILLMNLDVYEPAE